MAQITAHDITTLLETMGWTRQDLTRRLQLSPGTLNHWLAGRRSPTGLYALELEKLIAQAALIRAQIVEPATSARELQSMVNRIVAVTTPEEPEGADPLVKARNDGRREAVRLILDAIVTTLYVNPDGRGHAEPQQQAREEPNR